MLELLQVLGAGMLISFLGQLPFGNMNLTATQLNVQEGHLSAWKYALGIALVEIIYLRLALTGMDWVTEHRAIFIFMGWLTVVVFMALGIIGFVYAGKQSREKKSMLLNNKMDRFLLGVSISAINPAQIPFWFLWSTQMIQNGILQPTFAQYNVFTAGAGIGSLAGLAIYIHGGKWAIQKMNTSNRGLNRFMGVIFILAALLQLYHMIFRPGIK